MLAILAIIVLVFWGFGLAMHLAGGLIHIALVIAAILFVLHFFKGGKSTV